MVDFEDSTGFDALGGGSCVSGGLANIGSGGTVAIEALDGGSCASGAYTKTGSDSTFGCGSGLITHIAPDSGSMKSACISDAGSDNPCEGSTGISGVNGSSDMASAEASAANLGGPGGTKRYRGADVRSSVSRRFVVVATLR